ncbi:MAG: diguanylate cyclase [Planctomycetota bacterium]
MIPGTSTPRTSQPTDTNAHPSAGCVLVVRSDDLRERVGAALAAAGLGDVAVEASPSFLSAMGRLVNAKPEVIIGPVSAMTGMVDSTARALRKLAPAARLIALAQPNEQQEARAAVEAGFDQVVEEPVDATLLLAALGLTPPVHSTGPALPHPPGLDTPEPIPAETPGTGTASAVALEAFPPAMDDSGEIHSAFELHDTTDEPHCIEPLPPADPVAGGNGEAVSVPPAENGSSDGLPDADAPVAAEPAGSLGDVDLVASILEDGGTLPQRAEQLLAQQSGIVGVALAQAADEVPPDHAVVAVHSAAQPLGLLHAPPPTTADELSPWADWIAHWLALEKHVAQLRQQAMTDELTGAWNRRFFQQFLEERLAAATRERQQVTLLLFDIDDFKQYNDNYGHPAGDEILKETARLIQSLVRDHDVVARIGGDEFAVIFWDKGEPRHLGSQHPDNVLGIARRFQKAISEHKFPKLGKEAVGTLTVSGGLAGFPWDGRTPEELIAQADAMAIQSKRKGKNAVCFGPGCAPFSNGNENASKGGGTALPHTDGDHELQS